MKRKQITSILLSFMLTASAFCSPVAQVPAFAAEEAVEEELNDEGGVQNQQQNAESSVDENTQESSVSESTDVQDDADVPASTNLQDEDDTSVSAEEEIVDADSIQGEAYSESKDGNTDDFIFKGTVSVTTKDQEIIPEAGDGKSSEELFAEYVDKSFSAQNGQSGQEPSGRKRAPKSAASSLTGIDRAIYDEIAACLPAIAAGERASTEFEIDVDDLGLEKTFWTADELGIASVFTLDEYGNVLLDDEGNASISEETVNAIDEMTEYDLSKITGALLADHPYQLYWYEKTQNTRATGYTVTATYDDEEEDYVAGIIGSFTISFPVAEEYSAGGYMVDTSIGQNVQTSVANANAIVTEYGSVTDYEKLCGYRDEICDLVSYNDEAAGGGVSYGNPWQMIWVFDGDPDTNVVCEGYSKAFKYLCDQSEFSGDISCITVTGTMTGGTGEGPHMWNIVNMEDGENYLVDVTNCDEGTVGEPDLLFLAGGPEGGVETGLTFYVNDESIVYVYDENANSIYEISDLFITNEYYKDRITDDPVSDLTEGEWTYYVVNGKAVITNYSGHEETAVVPASLGGYSVEAVGHKVFYGNNSIRRIEFSEGIKWLSYGHMGYGTEIGNDIFPSICACRSLTSISIPSTMDLSGFVINQSGSYINECDALETIEVSEQNPYIKSVDNVLYSKDGQCLITYPSAKKDKVMYVPEGIRYILDYAFAENYFNLEEVVLPDSIEKIGMNAFCNDYRLKKLNIPEGCTFIGQFFIANTCIEELTIPSSVTVIMPDAFYAVNSITKITVDSDNPLYYADDSILRKGDQLIWYFPGHIQKEYAIPDGITKIDQGAFHNAKLLESIIIPEGVTDIDHQVFFNCFSLKHINIPLSMEHIGDHAFANCSKLTDVDYPGTFEQWEEIYIGQGNDYLNSAAIVELNPITVSGDFNGIHWELDDNELTITGEGPIDYSGIYPWMAYRLYIKELVVDEGITEIASNAFLNCMNLTSVEFPDSLLCIRDYAFLGCSSLTDVRIPVNVNDIGSAVFGGCPGIVSISVDQNNSVYDSREDCNAIIKTNENTLIQGCQNTVIPDSITIISWSAFAGCTQMETITIPDGVESISSYAFQNCTGLIEIELPDSLNLLGEGAFSGCTGLTSFSVPEDVYCGTRLFDGCTNLTDIHLPDSLTSISDYMFMECSNLASIRIPNNVTAIGMQGFLSCINLQEITIPEQVTRIGENAFENCKNLMSVTIPGGITEIPNYAFNDCLNLRDVYFGGSEEDWNELSIGEWNAPLASATIHFNATGDGGFKIVSHPSDVQVMTGEQVLFSVEAQGKDLTYQWQWSSNGTTWKNCSSAGYNTDTFSFTMKASLSGRQYRCKVTCDGETLISEVGIITLSVRPEIISQPADVEAEAGETVTFTIGVQGEAPAYQWQWSANGTTWKNCSSAGFNTDTFSFKMKETLSGRKYRCRVTCGGETLVSDAATITLSARPEIISQPADVEAGVGETVTFTVGVQGEDPAYQWQWSANGTTWKTCSSTGYNTDTFSFKMKETLSGRQYRCRVTCGGETLVSDAATITLSVRPAIISQPADVEAGVGETVTFTVGVQGEDPAYQWQWSANGTTWKNCSSAGFNTDTFSFKMKETLSGRQYRCKVACGGETLVSDAATITLSVRPQIISQPADVEAGVGETVTFTVGVQGENPVYQWQWSADGTTWKNCSSAGYNTDTFSFTMKATVSGRRYRCRVTFGEETLTSEAGTITLK